MLYTRGCSGTPVKWNSQKGRGGEGKDRIPWKRIHVRVAAVCGGKTIPRIFGGVYTADYMKRKPTKRGEGGRRFVWNESIEEGEGGIVGTLIRIVKYWSYRPVEYLVEICRSTRCNPITGAYPFSRCARVSSRFSRPFDRCSVGREETRSSRISRNGVDRTIEFLSEIVEFITSSRFKKSSLMNLLSIGFLIIGSSHFLGGWRL